MNTSFPAEGVQGASPPGLPALSRSYLQALLRGDRAEALDVVIGQGLRRGVPVAALQLEVIQPAQREVGVLWEQNQISVAQEHLATSISQLVVAHLYPHLPRRAPNGKRVVVACVEGELHELGARMGADFFEMAGFDVHMAGPGCTVEQLVRLLEGEGADLLGLSATTAQQAGSLRRTVERVRASRGEAFPIVLGGALVGLMPGLPAELGVLAWGTSADEILELCRMRTGW